MVELAGGVELLGSRGRATLPMTWEEVAGGRPELLVLAPCGFDADGAGGEASRFRPAGCRRSAVDANAYCSRPAPRLAEGVAQLAHLFHPDAVEDPGLPEIRMAPAATR